MPKMRAKMVVGSVEQFSTSEKLNLNAVSASKYPDDGSDENNTFAKFSPDARMTITIANPQLIGQFKPGQKFYVDFTEAE